VHLDELDLEIPAELVAQTPMQPRDACRLMVVDPVGESIVHDRFHELPRHLLPGDVLVINDSRVIAARLWVHKTTGGRVELLLLHPCAGDDGLWEALARPSGRLRPGEVLLTPRGREVRLAARLGEGRWHVGLQGEPRFPAVLEEEGEMPLPPYIKTPLASPDDYQTVYAQSQGSAAAPTAGLHFTRELLDSLRAGGVDVVPVTLHVGIDTFRPVTEERVEEHRIHREAYDVPPDSIARLDAARAEGRRLVAVGTTAVRVLETLYRDAEPGAPTTASPAGWTGLFITPGHRFRAVDAMVTNFHLPRTSLLALVMAFAGLDVIRNAYMEAVRERYRVYSFGDAMLITRPQARGREGAHA
jgi:S-adenosylmethionine:tRNA ribosyltransferase-isomerase